MLLVPANRPLRSTPAVQGIVDAVVLDVEAAVVEAGRAAARDEVVD